MKFFRQLQDSIIDFDFYKQAAFQRVGVTFKYFLLLLLIVGIIQGFNTYKVGGQLIDAIIYQFENNFPDFTLENGQLQIAGDEPYSFKDGQEMLILIDDSGQTDTSILDNYYQGFIFARDYIVVKDYYQTQHLEYADMGEVYLDKARVIGWLELARVFLIIPALLTLLWVYISKLVGTLFLALLGFLANAIHGADLKFQHLWNISAYALTLPILLKLLVSLTGLNIPYFSLFYWLIAFFYVYKSVDLCNQPTPEIPAE